MLSEILTTPTKILNPVTSQYHHNKHTTDNPLDYLRRTLSHFAEEFLPPSQPWCVALSGGSDSLALTLAAASLRPTIALIIDHQLQTSSAHIANCTAHQALRLGCIQAKVIPVKIHNPSQHGGLEAAARQARYQALEHHRQSSPVLLGHTRDDQAETVLLGLARGSGPRSLAGMRPYTPPWCRPFLEITHLDTIKACQYAGISFWNDPHNDNPRFTRVRLRHEVIPLLDDIFHRRICTNLSRSAYAFQEYTDLVDELAQNARSTIEKNHCLDVKLLEKLPPVVARSVIRLWILDHHGCRLTEHHLRTIYQLITHWHGQGGIAVGSHLKHQRLIVLRKNKFLQLRREPIR